MNSIPENSRPTEAQPPLALAAGSAWIACADRLPTHEDSNDMGEVWWWLPRFASYGAQRDYWHAPEDATHWMRCPDGFADDDVRPSSPNTKDESRGGQRPPVGDSQAR